LINRFKYFHGVSRETNYHNMAKRIYVSYFCWKNKLTVVSSTNINHNGCKLSATFKENHCDNLIINSLSTSRGFQCV